MTARRDALLAACEEGDHAAIHRLGFGEVWELLATGWAPRQTCSMNELKPWVKLVGNEDPSVVLMAIQECAGVWRPTPGQIRGHLNERRGKTHSVDVGRAADPAATREAIEAVAEAVRRGEAVCHCGCPTSRAWRIDPLGVLRCPQCDRLEVGQRYGAVDAGLLEEDE